MGVARSYEIYCDKCTEPFDGGDAYLSTVRDFARKAGWVTGPEGDFCPKHTPQRMAMFAQDASNLIRDNTIRVEIG